MAYKKEVLLANALKAIKEHNLLFFDDIPTYIGIARCTLYDKFPNESDGKVMIHKALSCNRMRMKNSMRRKWYESEAPALQIALYRLIADDHETERLNQQFQVKGKVDVQHSLTEFFDKVREKVHAYNISEDNEPPKLEIQSGG